MPSEGITSFIGQTISMTFDDKAPVIKYKITYQNNGGKKWSDESEINFGAFKDVRWLGHKDQIKEIAKSLKLISGDLSKKQINENNKR